MSSSTGKNHKKRVRFSSHMSVLYCHDLNYDICERIIEERDKHTLSKKNPNMTDDEIRITLENSSVERWLEVKKNHA